MKTLLNGIQGMNATGKRLTFDVPKMLESIGTENNPESRALLTSVIRESTRTQYPDLEITIYQGEV